MTSVQPGKREAEKAGPANAKKAKTLEGPVMEPSFPTYTTSDQFIRLLVTAKVDEIRPPDNRIFVAQRTDRVVDVFRGLILHNFLSVPVLSKVKVKWYGLVDIYDIVKFVVGFFGETEELKKDEDFFKLAEKSEEFQKKTVNDIMTYPIRKRNPFHPVNSGYSLMTAVEALARERGLHRVPVVDKDFNLISIITQSQLVQSFSKNIELIGDKKNKPINKTSHFPGEVLSVTENVIAMHAFKLMVEQNVSGLAVVNAEGKITGAISIRDLKAMSADGRLFWRLYQPLKEYLAKVNLETPADGRPRRVVTVKPTDTLETAIRLLAEKRVHRVFIVDNEMKPVGVLSLKDVLLEIIEENPPGA
jgi:CBS domain-containing protein